MERRERINTKRKSRRTGITLARRSYFIGKHTVSAELNAKYPGGIEAQKEKLEAEGHTIIQKGRTNRKYFVKDFERVLFDLKR